MALQFVGEPILGSHGPLEIDPVSLQLQRTKFWGLRGESELFGYDGGRKITVECWIYDPQRPATLQELDNHLALFDVRAGEHGALEEIGPSDRYRIFENTTFVSLSKIPMHGRQGPFFDVAGCLVTDEDGVRWATWWCPVRLEFYQLLQGIPPEEGTAVPGS